MPTPLQQPRNLVFLSQAFQYPSSTPSDLSGKGSFSFRELSLNVCLVQLDGRHSSLNIYNLTYPACLAPTSTLTTEHWFLHQLRSWTSFGLLAATELADTATYAGAIFDPAIRCLEQ